MLVKQILVLVMGGLMMLTACSQPNNVSSKKKQQPKKPATKAKKTPDKKDAKPKAKSTKSAKKVAPKKSENKKGSAAKKAVAGERVTVGKPAPNFALKDQDGKQTSLAELLKKGNVALVFYRSANW